MTTDGFSDQCDPEKSRFGSKRLKKILTEKAGLPMHEQCNTLLGEMKDHQKDEKQRDDITVIGIKIK